MQPDRETIIEMHTYRRPHKSDSEAAFIERFILPLDVKMDSFGNLYKMIGDQQPNILWSSHTDSVHTGDGRQKVAYDSKRDLIKLPKDSTSTCLGADCAAGVWIMTEMIKASVPGLYVFHRDEERGHNGASHILKDGKLLDGIEMAVAFDRKGNDSIITQMAGARTCSDAFADSLADQLPGFKKDPTGLWTDTYAYRFAVAECTNLSIGYEGAHSATERLSLSHLIALRDVMVSIDSSRFVVQRDPTKLDRKAFDFYKSGRSTRWPSAADLFEEPTVLQLVRDNPKTVALLLEEHGVTYAGLRAEIVARQKNVGDAFRDLAVTTAEAESLDAMEALERYVLSESFETNSTTASSNSTPLLTGTAVQKTFAA